MSLFPEREREERDQHHYISRVDMEEEEEAWYSAATPPRSFADAVVLFALPVSENDDDDANEDENRALKFSYAEIRSYSKRLKELRCGKVIDSFLLSQTPKVAPTPPAPTTRTRLMLAAAVDGSDGADAVLDARSCEIVEHADALTLPMLTR